jgi:GDP-4-dehydro-6-deoxy-D-mannose reductase
MRVLITGAGGFVGGYLIRHLQEIDAAVEVVGVVHPGVPSALPPADVRFVPCDIVAGGSDLRRLIEETAPDRLYHLAGAASGASSDRDQVFQVNIDGTRNVLNASQDIVAPRHILFAGTGYVYGPCDPLRPAREDDPLPMPGQYGLYAESKQRADDMVRACKGAVIARSFNHTGPGQTPAFSIPAFASQIVQIERGRQTELRVGNIDSSRDFLDVRDVVRAYRLLLEHGVGGEVYNVCSGQARRMCDVLDSLRSLANVPIPITKDPDRMRPSDIPISVGDPGKIHSLTGWQPVIPLSQTLSDILDWWRSQ